MWPDKPFSRCELKKVPEVNETFDREDEIRRNMADIPDTRTGVIRDHMHAYGEDGICISSSCEANVNEGYDIENMSWSSETKARVNEIKEGVEMPVEFTSAVINVKELARLSKEHNVMISFNISPIDFEEDEESE